MNWRARRVFAFLVLGQAAVALAAPIEAEGVALIGSAGIEYARQMAIQDARNQAALAAGATIEANQVVSPAAGLLESARLRPVYRVRQFSVLREWQSGQHLYVRIAAETEPGSAPAAAAAYRKKIIATPFIIRRSFVTDDIENASRGVAAELLRNLEDSRQFLAVASQFGLPIIAAGASHDAESVIRLASAHDSQFVIAGEIVDAGIGEEGGLIGLFKQKRRRFEIDMTVYDGMTGAVVVRHRVADSVAGEVAIGRDKPFASAAFWGTQYGALIGRTIRSGADMVARDLAQLPFTARIMRVSNGQIYIDAGGTSGVAPGDRLVAYRLQREWPLEAYGSGSHYGIKETPVATVMIAQVQPKFSIGAVLGKYKEFPLEAGDLVRFDLGGHGPATVPSSHF